MMRSATTIILVTCVTRAAAELKAGPVQQADLDNTTLGVLTYPVKGGLRIPLSHLSPPLRFPMTQGRRDLSQQWTLPWDRGASANVGANLQVMQAAKLGAVAAFASEGEAEPPVEGPLNVFGEKLEGCENEGDFCAYSEESPDLCIRTGKIQMRVGCKSIWNADWKPFKTVSGQLKKDQPPVAGDTTKCNAVPAEVLDSQYSKDQWNSAEGSAAIPTFLKADIKESPRSMPKGQRFRKSIDFICETCALYAESETAKQSLLSKCKAMGWSSTAQTFALTPPSIISNVAIALIGLVAGSGVTFMALFSRRGAAAAAKY